MMSPERWAAVAVSAVAVLGCGPFLPRPVAAEPAGSGPAPGRSGMMDAEAQLKRGGIPGFYLAPLARTPRESPEAALLAARVGYETAAERLRQAEAAYRAGVVTSSELEEARAALVQARAGLEVSEARLRDAGSTAGSGRLLVRQQWSDAHARVEAAEALHKRAAALKNAGMGSRQELLQARSSLEAARWEQALADEQLRGFPPRPAADRPPAPVPGDLAESRLRAARSDYEAALQVLREGGDAGLEDLYIRSRRWLEAEVSAARERSRSTRAYDDHVGRMKELRRLIRSRQDAGLATSADSAAADFYLSQARLDREQAKGR